MTLLRTLFIADDAAKWAGFGFDVADGRTSVGGVDLAFQMATDERHGLFAWDLDVAADAVEGVAVRRDVSETGRPTTHRNGVDSIDHLVLSTPVLERTVATLESLGLPCRRRRDAGAYGSTEMHQAFFWLGTATGGRLILELAGPAQPKPGTENDPATFFGLAFTCSDLSATCAFFGDLMKPPFDAVQPGRRITTLSSRAGSTVPLAFMSAHVGDTESGGSEGAPVVHS